jgi:hypothetical protein
MSTLTSGSVTQFFLYDVAEAIDLSAVRRLIGSAAPARIAPKPPTPPYIQYVNPPISIDGHVVGMGRIEEFDVRFKAFDYGVVSLALTAAVPNTWDRLLVEAPRWHDDATVAAAAEQCCRAFVERLSPAISRPRAETLLSEDYLVVTATGFSDPVTADDLMSAHGSDIAQLLRGERDPLSMQERDEVLRHRISYLASDLVVPTWNAAFVYDTDAGAQGTLEILEFANSQLLEFRYYDQLLDQEMERIYRRLQGAGWLQNWLGRRYTRAARQVHALFIDVNELTDRTENALKIVGDVYAARLFTLTAARLGLDHWKGSVQEKLKTLDDIYRFAVEQTSMARGEFLELVIVLILVLELVLFAAGIMR